ncbi:ABC transporter ATP-binding protein [Kribbella antibiotica]|uniref:ABC transporter ATP-binding protein n=1 Tax=Kribbella antibiotica TaxID=190195 RepID=A0A4V2YNB9_9ACTN|nr:ABC transporter ATP-binding protein [Kribbella antibiotica]
MLVLVGLLAVAVASATLGDVAEGYCVSAGTADLRHRVADAVVRSGLSGQRRFSAGDLAARTVGVAPQVGRIAPLAVQVVTNLVLSVGGLVLLWRIDWRLVLTLAAAAPLGAVLLRMFAGQAAESVQRYQELQSEIATRLTDALAGVRTIRAAGTAELETERVLAPMPALAAAGRSLWSRYGGLAGRTTLLAPLTTVVVLAVAGLGLRAGRLSLGEFLAAAAYTPMALGLLSQIPLLVSLVRVRVSARRLLEVLDVPVRADGFRELPAGSGRLELRGVAVDGVLDRVDLVVPGGLIVAVVGASGAGKTVLAEVAGGLIAPDEGVVLLDGVLLDELAPEVLRREIAYAFEQPALLGRTVGDVIAYGGTAGGERIAEAAVVAQADAFVRRLPDGYATAMSEVPLSGGEAQRLGLARAFVRDARLLILDDATSSLDSITEAQVNQAVLQPGSRTRLLIAHRAATARRADLVVWLHAGRVRAVGPHDELWADDAYRTVFIPRGQ